MTVLRKRCATCNRQRGETAYTNFKLDKVCKDCGKKRRTRNRRAQHYREEFDITLDEYFTLHARYDGLCWICNGKRKWLDVDHNHQMVKDGMPIRQTIRGLLCPRCNRQMLRAAQDDPVRLRRAAEYLERMEAQEEL